MQDIIKDVKQELDESKSNIEKPISMYDFSSDMFAMIDKCLKGYSIPLLKSIQHS